MVEIERNLQRYNLVNNLRKTEALSEQWQQQVRFSEQSLQNRQELNNTRQRQLNKTNTTAKTQSTSRIQSVQKLSQVNQIDRVEGVDGINSAGFQGINFNDAGRFDMKQDMADFIKPQNITPEYLKKDTLNKTGTRILAYLDMVDASDSLKKRAHILFEEENNVKAITDAYRNALVFA